jgi:hypothetical protein
MTFSDAPSCGVTYDPYSDNSRGAIYNRNIFIMDTLSGITLGVVVLSVVAPEMPLVTP